MKESGWDECIKQNTALSIRPDPAKARSLVETAKGRIDFLEEQSIKEANVSYIFEGWYACVLELLHALVILQGHNVSNHICLGFYLRDVCKKERLFRLFDDCRLKRNALVYYGKRLDMEIAQQTIAKCKQLVESLDDLRDKV